MGSLFGAKPKGPSLAQKTQDFYMQMQQNQAASRAAQASATPSTPSPAAAVATSTNADNELLKKTAGGFFGTGTYLGGSSSGLRGTFLS